jgi:membrane protein implicated in regulation of membrane protease activity
VTTFFLVTAALGFGLLLLGLVVDDFLEFMDGDGGVLSAPVIGAFLGAFGIGGFVATSATGNVLVGVVAAGAAGLVLGWVALRLSLAFLGMHTDATPASGDYLGQLGRVVTPISRGGGEILIRVGGSPVKLIARADTEIDRGTEIVVVEVLSPTSVRVMTTNELLDQE